MSAPTVAFGIAIAAISVFLAYFIWNESGGILGIPAEALALVTATIGILVGVIIAAPRSGPRRP